MAERDPAFLYYDADVALDVQHMNRLERGCYFDLVQMYRRFRGYTAEQLRNILGTDYEACWNSIRIVLEYDEVAETYHIPWLRNSLEKKKKSNDKQRERIQTYWDLVKQGLAPPPKNPRSGDIPRNKSGTNPEHPPNNRGYSGLIPKIETETETGGVKGGAGENGGGEAESGLPPPRQEDWSHLPQDATRLAPAMLDVVTELFPDYPRQDQKDFAPALQIAYQLANIRGWPFESVLNGRMPQLLAEWRAIVVWAKADKWFRTKSISFWNDKFQDLIQAKNNGTRQATTTGTGKSGAPPHAKSAGAVELAGKLAAKLAARGVSDSPGEV